MKCIAQSGRQTFAEFLIRNCLKKVGDFSALLSTLF